MREFIDSREAFFAEEREAYEHDMATYQDLPNMPPIGTAAFTARVMHDLFGGVEESGVDWDLWKAETKGEI